MPRLDSISEIKAKAEFYSRMREAYQLLGTWVLTSRYLGQSYATIMRWSAETHAPSREKRMVLSSRVAKLHRMTKARRADLATSLSSHQD